MSYDESSADLDTAIYPTMETVTAPTPAPASDVKADIIRAVNTLTSEEAALLLDLFNRTIVKDLKKITDNEFDAAMNFIGALRKD